MSSTPNRSPRPTHTLQNNTANTHIWCQLQRLSTRCCCARALSTAPAGTAATAQRSRACPRDCRSLRRAHSLRAADQARVHLHRTVLHRAARARHAAAHSGVRLLHPERQLPAGRQHFVQLLRRSLRDVRERLLPGGRFLPRRHRGGRRGHADELLQLRRQIKATSAKRRELPPLFSSSAFFQANRHDLSAPRIEWGI